MSRYIVPLCNDSLFQRISGREFLLDPAICVSVLGRFYHQSIDKPKICTQSRACQMDRQQSDSRVRRCSTKKICPSDRTCASNSDDLSDRHPRYGWTGQSDRLSVLFVPVVFRNSIWDLCWM